MSDLAIVTVSHNSEADLARLLDSIDRRLRAAPPQVVVVDSASSDGSAALARDRGATVVALEANVGFGAGCNAGLALVDAEVTALVNPDVELLDDGLAALAERARAAQALLAPRLVHADGRVQDSAHPPPGRAADLVPALAAAPAPPTAPAAPLRAVAERPHRPGRVGDRRVPRGPHEPAAVAGTVRRAGLPVLRGHGALPGGRPERRADRAAPGHRRQAPRRHVHAARAGGRRGPRAPRGSPEGGGGARGPAAPCAR